MIEQPSRTLVCSIVFIDIVDYSTKPVAEQLLLKQAFNKLLSDAPLFEWRMARVGVEGALATRATAITVTVSPRLRRGRVLHQQ
jgi:hypothetical protein